jgi:parvulin-like peptidyl-prolyl isomerase
MVPEAADKPSTPVLSTTMVALMGLHAVDALFSEGSWPWLLAREVYYGTTGRNEYMGRILKQVQEDPQLGPVGCYFASVLLDWTLPAAAGDFRQLALQKMSAADFRQDWGLLAQACSAEQREAMADLLEKVRAGSQTQESGLLREALGTLQLAGGIRFTPLLESLLQELRREPDRMLSVAITAAMDRVWDETLSGMLRERLTPKGSDGKPVDAARVAAVVGGTEVTRSEVEATVGILRKEPTIKPGATQAELEQEALKAQIEVALLHAAFKAMGNKVTPAQMDADVKATVKKSYRGSMVRFLQSLRNEGYTMDEYRMLQEKNLVAGVMREKIRGMAPQPTEKEISQQMAQGKPGEERQVRLHTLSLMKQSTEKKEDDPRKLAEKLHEKLKAGQDFEPLAQKYSADSRAADGGGMDWLNPAVLSPEIAKALAVMKPGDVSAVLDLGAQWLIVKLDEERTQTHSPEARRKAATVELRAKKAKEFYDAWLENTRSKIRIHILPAPVSQGGK